MKIKNINMCVCSVVSKQNAMKAVWDSDLIEIKNCKGPKFLSTVSNIYIIARSKKKKNMYVCVISRWKQSGTMI